MTQRLPNYYLAAAVPDKLRNRQCRACRAPVDEEYKFCFQCSQRRSTRPDLAGFVAYAVNRGQSGTEMHRYKNQHPSPQALNNVRLLLEHGLSHLRCAGQLVGAPVGAVAVIPSRSHYMAGTPSPLQQLCAWTIPQDTPVAELHPTVGSVSDRRVHGNAFKVAKCPDQSHITLVDDTWVSGATTLSAAAALRNAGVQRVSVLVLARWLDRNYDPTKKLPHSGQPNLWLAPTTGGMSVHS